MFLNCGLSRHGIFHLKSATTASCVWMTCCMPAPPASLEQTQYSGVSTLSSTTSLLSGACACTSTRRQTRSDARSDCWTNILIYLQMHFICFLFDACVMDSYHFLPCTDCVFSTGEKHISWLGQHSHLEHHRPSVCGAMVPSYSAQCPCKGWWCG